MVFLRGNFSNSVVEKCVKIIKHQQNHGIQNGLRGFLFYGEPGTGKTTCATVISEKLGFMPNQIGRFDSGDIADEKYGRSEKRIKEIFTQDFNLLIFDDVDGLFLTRSYGVKLETWYLTHLNVLFGQIDKMDTSKLMVMMTTNRIDMIDDALKDRLLLIEFPLPEKEVLKEVAQKRCSELDIPNEQYKFILDGILKNSEIKTFRDVENFVISQYVEMF
ncbi:MAG: VCP-like ATPase [Candidatus Heimdallarchaeota archaeon LC_3]|nr:MAG: VCP-like ATPase [Candidatus Heimdallarchaeota archaeon LC_3]